MENINEFMEQAKIEILSYLPEDVRKELTIEDARVVKMNDQVLYGLTMKRSAEESAPAIYMNDLYRRFNEGEPFNMLMSEAALEYLNAVSVAPPEITTMDLTFDKIKDDLTLKLVEIRRNHEYLSEVPYVKAGNGFAIVCDIKIEDGDLGQYRTTVTRNLMNEMNYDMQELFSTAIESAQLKDPAVMNSVRSQLLYSDEPNLLRGQDPIREEEKDNMYVITNPDCLYGAIALYYPGIQEKIAEKLGENYYVIPSSVNEVLAVPESKAPEIQEIAAMVYEANENLLDPKDVLSNNIFYFDKDTKRLETIHSEMFRGINSQEQESRS
ncbi:MAG: hypothetical protein II038_17350 [Lachnospiraceae bacterium]|nr:hypothetical protein [Lachnospiraceae bacterium]MBQ4217925.1 hypothetical protein [Butyrivibrio sp.]